MKLLTVTVRTNKTEDLQFITSHEGVYFLIKSLSESTYIDSPLVKIRDLETNELMSLKDGYLITTDFEWIPIQKLYKKIIEGVSKYAVPDYIGTIKELNDPNLIEKWRTRIA